MILFLVQGVIRNGIFNYRNGYGKSIIDFPGKHSNIYSYIYINLNLVIYHIHAFKALIILKLVALI